MRVSTLRRKAATIEDVTYKKLMVMLAFLSAFAEPRLEGRGYDPDASLVTRARQAQTVITVVVIGVVALIGVLIFAQVEAALPELNDSPLSDSTTEVTEGFGSAIGFVPIILIVLLASVVIMVVQRMRT